MSNIIKFRFYNWRKRDDTMKFEELIQELSEKNKNGHEYSSTDISRIANTILESVDYYSGCGATPIVKIAKEFEFKTYKETLRDGQSGDIHINGETAEKYGHDKIILVNKNEDLFHQRFVVAHELAHYLFEFLGNSDYSDSNEIFVDAYYKNKHETPQERRANKFAAAILMPEELFIKQYNIAKSVDSNRLFTIQYLSRFFETSIASIEMRIMEVLG